MFLKDNGARLKDANIEKSNIGANDEEVSDETKISDQINSNIFF